MNRRELFQTSALALAGCTLERNSLAKDTTLNSHADVPRTNWSRNLRYGTDTVYAPANADEVRDIVLQCPRVKQLGSQHCFNNIANSHEAQISLRALKGIDIDHAARTATVGAGVRYGELAPVLDKAGSALNNLASLPHISVGGTIATATHGSGVRNQNLVAPVRAIEFITADGRTVVLSRDKDGERFRLAVVHLGALGVLTRVTLDLLPRFDMSQVVYQNLSFDQLEHHLDTIMGAGYSVSLFTNWQRNKASTVWIKDRVEPGATQKPVPPEFYGATLQGRSCTRSRTTPPRPARSRWAAWDPGTCACCTSRWSSHPRAAKNSRRSTSSIARTGIVRFGRWRSCATRLPRTCSSRSSAPLQRMIYP